MRGLCHLSVLRYTPRDAFGAEAGCYATKSEVLTLQWREKPLREKEALTHQMYSWKVHVAMGVGGHTTGGRAADGAAATPVGWLCYYCNGSRDEAGGGCEAGAPFCSAACVDNWAVQVGAGNAPRARLFEHERGICQRCRLDCHAIYLRLRPLDAKRRRQLLGRVLPRLTSRRCERIVRFCHEGDLWQADHKLAVQHGGGESCVDAMNLQTLCVPCHQEKTASERAAMSTARKRKGAKKQAAQSQIMHAKQSAKRKANLNSCQTVEDLTSSPDA